MECRTSKKTGATQIRLDWGKNKGFKLRGLGSRYGLGQICGTGMNMIKTFCVTFSVNRVYHRILIRCRTFRNPAHWSSLWLWHHTLWGLENTLFSWVLLLVIPWSSWVFDVFRCSTPSATSLLPACSYRVRCCFYRGYMTLYNLFPVVYILGLKGVACDLNLL